MNDIIKAVVSAVIAYLVPVALKQFLPPVKTRDELPVLAWCVACFVGGALGGIASGLVTFAGLGGAGGIGNWAAYGTSLGIMQWFALRSYRPVGGWFVLACSVGWLLFPLAPGLGWVVSGLAIGLLQYLGLTHYKGAGWWIPANLIAWPLAGVAGLAIGTMLSANMILAWVVGWGVVGLVGGVILLWPLSRLKGT